MTDESRPAEIMLFGVIGVGSPLHFEEQEDDIFRGFAPALATGRVNLRTCVHPHLAPLDRRLSDAPFVGLHLAAHGDEEGAIFGDFGFGAGPQGVAAEPILNVVKRHALRYILLSVCYSKPVAEVLATHVDCVIGVEGKLRLSTAKLFDEDFCAALARGESVHAAFEAGRVAASLPNPFHGERLYLFEKRPGVAAETFPLKDGRPLPGGDEPVYIVGSDLHRRAIRRLAAHLVPVASYSAVLKREAGDMRDVVSPRKLEKARLVPIMVGRLPDEPAGLPLNKDGALQAGVDTYYSAEEIVTLIEDAAREAGQGRVPFFPVLPPYHDRSADRIPFGLRRITPLRIEPPADFATAAAEIRRILAARP